MSYGTACYSSNSFQYLRNTVAATSAQIPDKARASALKLTERPDVRGCEIGDVDVIADAGPVWSRVVSAKDFERGPCAESRPDGQRDEVRLGIVFLAKFSVGIGSSSIEVSKDGCAESMGHCGIEDEALAHQL